MDLYIIRHAEAVPIGQDGVKTDEERFLTPAGMASCRPLGRTLRRVAGGLTKLYASPLVRARHTAEGLIANWGDGAPELEESPLLAPGGKKRKILELLRDHDGEAVGLVGHNPDLSELIGWFLGDRAIGIELEKSGVACVHFNDKPAKGGGTLSWLITPTWCQSKDEG